ncbi:hypothetical protein CYMTET_13338 [Cymbomonas tetramitiformis]|uniref:Complex 1 LYR protein domain-containing protein n=1 Tax=Cymbomonas tetramitiformis TaxID=36881 RepID=A0AAE0GIP3_9CHLO|nr:hypothetical protein CYMTET_13338 [Cymbomonas tetramitiformis]
MKLAVIALYRALWKEAAKMPTEYRRDFIRRRIRRDFEASKNESDPEQVQFLVQLGHTQLENITVQAEHLSEVAKMDLSNIKGVKNTVV